MSPHLASPHLTSPHLASPHFTQARAAALYSDAADNGLANAQFNLALMYANGIGVEQDEVSTLLVRSFNCIQNSELRSSHFN